MGNIVTKLILVAASIAVVACGNSSSEEEAQLSAGLDGPEAVVNVSFRYGAAEFVVTGTRDAEFVLGWIQFDGATTVSLVARRYDTAMQARGSDVILVGPTTRPLAHLSACGRTDGSYSVSWVDIISPTDFNGRANIVLGDNSTSGTFGVHPNDIGRQDPTDIACLSDGHAVVAWTNYCEATPPECATDPADGTYVRVFNAVGEPASPVQDVVLGQGPLAYAWLAPTSDGFALMTGTLLETRDAQGRPIASAATTRGPGIEGKLECPIEDGCLGLFNDDNVGVHVQWFDPREIDGAIDVEVAPVVREAPRVHVVPRTPSISCDADGQCLVVWLTQRESRFGDYYETESLGIDARIMNARTGVIGPTTRLVATDPGFWGRPKVTTFGERRFVLAYDVADTIVLRTVVATDAN